MYYLQIDQAFREDRTLLAATDFIIATIGQRYVDCPPLELDSALAESCSRSPLLFLLSPGELIVSHSRVLHEKS